MKSFRWARFMPVGGDERRLATGGKGWGVVARVSMRAKRLGESLFASEQGVSLLDVHESRAACLGREEAGFPRRP
jgi:hypothetical protein